MKNFGKVFLAWSIVILPFVGYALNIILEHNEMKSNVYNLIKEKNAIETKLDRIEEKLNIIDGKLTEHFRRK